MEKVRKRTVTVIKIIIVLILITALLTGIGIYRYVSNIPKLTANNWLQDVVSDNTFSWNSLYSIECSGDYSVELSILDTNIPDAKLIENNESIYVGKESGYIHLSAVGRGKRSEYGKEADTYLFTSYGTDEQEIVTEKIRDSLDALDKTAHEQFFKNEESELQKCAVSLNVFNYTYKKEEIAPIYHMEYRKSNGNLVYLKVKAAISLIDDNAEPYDVVVQEEDTDDSNQGLAVTLKNHFSGDNLAENMVISKEFRESKLRPDIIMQFDPKKLQTNDGSVSEEIKTQELEWHDLYYIIDVK